MTAQRQENKDQRLKIACLAAITGLLAGFFQQSTEVWAASTERIVVNRHTALAIDGFHPVAYFTDADAFAVAPDRFLDQADQKWPELMETLSSY